MERVLRVDVDGLSTLTLNRPEKLNALDTLTFRELNGHVADIERETDRIGCVILRGAGRAFCAGMDLNVVGREEEPPQFKPQIIDRLSRLPQPFLIAVHGACYTGGLELALTADLIIADGTARFADTHGKWGLVPTWGLCQRLPRRVGPMAAQRMMFTSCLVPAHEAKEIGLADILVEEGRLGSEAEALGRQILANSWHVNFAAKRMMRETDGMAIDRALAYETAHHPGHAPDHRNRIEGFEKPRR